MLISFKKKVEFIENCYFIFALTKNHFQLMDFNSTDSNESSNSKDIKIIIGALLVNGIFLVSLFLLFK